MSIIIRIWNISRGLTSRWVSFFERRNPEALLELEGENLHKRIVQFNESLVTHAALSERLKRQVAGAETQLADLASKTRALAKAGQTEAAGRYALQIKSVTAQLEEDRKSLARAEQNYTSLVATRDAAIAQTRQRIERLRHQIGDVKMKTALANLEGMASDMTRRIGGSGDSFARIEASLTEQQELAAAKLLVNGSVRNPDDTAARAIEEQVMGQQALEEFLASTAKTMPQPPLSLPYHAADPDPLASLNKTRKH